MYNRFVKNRNKNFKFNKSLLIVTSVLCFFGFAILFSSALGELASTNNFYKILIVQLAGIILGYIAIYYAIVTRKLDYKVLFKKFYALYFFIGCVIFQLLVFTPIGIERKGATRWLDIGFTTLQPSEFLKIALVLFLASLLVGFKKRTQIF